MPAPACSWSSHAVRWPWLVTLAVAPCAQVTFPAPGADPTGKVVDEHGKPLAGAAVELRVDLTGEGTWADSIAQVLSATPLPSAVSDQDGDFVLPLTPFQRTLGVLGEGSFWLVVTKPGHRTWTEHLPQGLRGYLGSRVVLPTRPEPDPFAELPWPPVVPAAKDIDDALLAEAELCRMPKSATRRPPPPKTREIVGTVRLVVKLRDEASQPLANVVLRFSDGLYARSPNVGTQTWISDGNGLVTIERMSPCVGDLMTVAAGRATLVRTLRVRRVEQEEVTFQLVPIHPVRVTTIDANGAPLPFAPVVLEVGIGGQRRRASSLESDSLGRLVLELTEDSPAALQAVPYSQRVPVDPRADASLDLLCPELETWFVLTSPTIRWSLSARMPRASFDRSQSRLGASGIEAFLVRAPVSGAAKFRWQSHDFVENEVDGAGGTSIRAEKLAARVFDRRGTTDSRPATRSGR